MMIKNIAITEETHEMIKRTFKYECIESEIFKMGCEWCNKRGADFFSYTPIYWKWFEMEFYDFHLILYNRNEFNPRPLGELIMTVRGFLDFQLNLDDKIRTRIFIEYEEYRKNPKKRQKVMKQTRVTKEIKTAIKNNLNTI